MSNTTVRDFAEKLLANVSIIIQGKDTEIRLVIAAILAKGHILLEDMPGTGKTVLAKAIASSLSGEFQRVQFTPDLLPTDITGVHFFNMQTQMFTLRKGAIFTNILLADEINRATPRTQSALLECMEEQQATIDGETHPIASPFFVIATQNPVEIQGTFPLPEAQLDRFLIQLSLGYGDRATEIAILKSIGQQHPVQTLKPVLTMETLLDAMDQTDRVKVNDAVCAYMADIGIYTRKDDRIRLGLSTRGLLGLKKMSQAYAVMQGRSFVLPEDVKAVAPYVIAHRIILRDYSFEQASILAGRVVQDILAAVPVPTEVLP